MDRWKEWIDGVDRWIDMIDRWDRYDRYGSTTLTGSGGVVQEVVLEDVDDVCHDGKVDGSLADGLTN